MVLCAPVCISSCLISSKSRGFCIKPTCLSYLKPVLWANPTPKNRRSLPRPLCRFLSSCFQILIWMVLGVESIHFLHIYCSTKFPKFLLLCCTAFSSLTDAAAPGTAIRFSTSISSICNWKYRKLSFLNLHLFPRLIVLTFFHSGAREDPIAAIGKLQAVLEGLQAFSDSKAYRERLQSLHNEMCWLVDLRPFSSYARFWKLLLRVSILLEKGDKSAKAPFNGGSLISFPVFVCIAFLTFSAEFCCS